MKDGQVNIAQLIRNRQNVCEYKVVASCDVHLANTFVFAVDIQSGRILIERYVHGGAKELLKALSKIKVPSSDTVVLYEAGSAGFSLHRTFRKHNYDCKVVVPSSILRQKGKKTDRTDAIEMFNYYHSGLLKFVTVPDERMEASRELLRYRYEVLWDRTSQKQKVQSMLRRHGLVFTGTKKSWTKTHWKWLKTVDVPCEIRTVLDLYLAKIESCDQGIAMMDEQLEKTILADERLNKLYICYQSMSGIGPLGAKTWIFEGQDLRRFSNPTRLMSYLGLVPMKNSSGTKDPALRITKTGNKYLRYVTVVAARSYSDRRLMQNANDLRKYPQPLADLVKKSQDRLNNKYQNLRNNKKN
jgi:transposase